MSRISTLLLVFIGVATGEITRKSRRGVQRRNTGLETGWRNLIETGPYVFQGKRRSDRFQNDDPSPGTIGSIALDDFFMNDEPFDPERDELDDYGSLNITKAPLNMSEVDPMDPEFCCNNDMECKCKFCCVPENVTCAIDVVVAVDICHCDNNRWIKTIEFLVHLVEEFKEKVPDFRFGLNIFNEISETVFDLEEWKPEWTLAEIYQKLDSYELDNFYGRGTSLHIGLDAAFKQFDHEQKRKSLLVLYSNGVSQSKDAEVLKVASKYPGPEIVSVTADPLEDCSGSLCPNKDLLQDLTSDILIDGSRRRQFWAAKEVRQYAENKFMCEEEKCEVCECNCEPEPPCDKDQKLLNQKRQRPDECEPCPDIPCPVDILFAIDMCHCDPQRFYNAQQFMIETANKVMPEANKAGQKVRMSVLQFNEVAVTSTHFAEFNGDGMDTDALADFIDKVQTLTVDAFHGMGTNMTTGLDHAKDVFEQEGMTQDDRDRMGISTNETEKVLILYSNGNSIDERSEIFQLIAKLKQEGNVRIIPVTADEENQNCDRASCPDDEFLTQIKDVKVDRWLDGTKVPTAVDAINKVISELECTDNSCENPCPDGKVLPKSQGPKTTCTSPFGETFPVSDYDDSALDGPEAENQNPMDKSGPTDGKVLDQSRRRPPSGNGDDSDGGDGDIDSSSSDSSSNSDYDDEDHGLGSSGTSSGSDSTPSFLSPPKPQKPDGPFIKPNPCPAINLAFIIDGSDSITGRPNGGEWKQIKNWVADVIKDLNLDSRPGMSYVSVMQYAYNTELLGQKWWPIGCDPSRRATASIEHALRNWRQLNTTTNTYQATYEMMESYDENYVGYLEHNPFSALIIVSDGEHRDGDMRNPAKLRELKEKFDLIQVVQTGDVFVNKKDWEKGTQTIPELRQKPNWMSHEIAFFQECKDQCQNIFKSVHENPDANTQYLPSARFLDDL